jgi:hypothetical protein
VEEDTHGWVKKGLGPDSALACRLINLYHQCITGTSGSGALESPDRTLCILVVDNYLMPTTPVAKHHHQPASVSSGQIFGCSMVRQVRRVARLTEFRPATTRIYPKAKNSFFPHRRAPDRHPWDDGTWPAISFSRTDPKKRRLRSSRHSIHHGDTPF